MTPDQFIGYALINTSAVTALVSTQSIFHGTVPQTSSLSALPYINFFALPGGQRRNGLEVESFSINCRARTAAGARAIARTVVDTFHGSSGTGMYGTLNGFDIARASLAAGQGAIPEPDNEAFNAPVDIQIAYASSTVS